MVQSLSIFPNCFLHSWFSWMKTTFGVIIRHPNSLKKIALRLIVNTMRHLKQYIASCTMSLFMNLLFCSKQTQLVWSLKLTTSYSMHTKLTWPSMLSMCTYGLMFILLHLVITISPSNEINHAHIFGHVKPFANPWQMTSHSNK